MSVYLSVFENLTYNGPAIWGGCVTRSCPDRSVGGKHRAGSWYHEYSGPENCHVLDPDRAESERHGVQGGYGVVFANPGTSFVEAGRVAVQVLSKPVNCHVTECFLGALAQCRAEGPDRSRRRASWGTSYLGARNLSRYRIYIAGRCACPGACIAGSVMGAGCRKNHDKQLTHIVRVMLRFYYCLAPIPIKNEFQSQ